MLNIRSCYKKIASFVLPIAMVACEVPATRKAVSNSPLPTRQQLEGQYSSVAEATLELETRFRPQIMAFGEFHNDTGVVERSSAFHFGTEILPVLKSRGFNQLVLEFAPDSRAAAIELAQHRQSCQLSPSLTPTLYAWIPAPDRTGVFSIYQNACGLNIWGSNYERGDNFAHYKPGEAAIGIGDRTRQIAATILADGQKVITYNGIYHNDIDPSPEHEAVSFGRYFNARYRYLEIDLIIPEMMGGYPMGQEEAVKYNSLVPREGVMLYRESERKFVYIFARTEATR